DLGIGPSIIQHDRGDDGRFLNTAWTVQAWRGLMMAAVLAVIALPVSWVYQDPRLVPLFVLTGGTAVIAGFNSTALFTLNRHLAIRQVSLFNLLGDVVTTAAIILSALWSPTAWAILIGWYARSLYRL